MVPFHRYKKFERKMNELHCLDDKAMAFLPRFGKRLALLVQAGCVGHAVCTSRCAPCSAEQMPHSPSHMSIHCGTPVCQEGWVKERQPNMDDPEKVGKTRHDCFYKATDVCQKCKTKPPKRNTTNQPMHQEQHFAPVGHSVKCPWQQQNVELTFRVTISVDELAQELSHACIQLGGMTHMDTHSK